ncbi:MAG: dihydropyrimidinase [Candidatus Aminicenantales bacterium]
MAGGRIVAVGHLAGCRAGRIIDASGLLVLPGAVDPHVHFNDKFMGTVSVHDYFTGTLAAAHGGVTTVIDFSNQEGEEPLSNTILRKKEEAAGLAVVDWGVHPVITRPTVKTLKSIVKAVELGAPTIKCYTTYRNEGLMIDFGNLKRILEALRRAGGMLMIHAEDNAMIEKNVAALIKAGQTRPIDHALSRPPEAENRAIRRAIQAAGETGGRLFIVHLASADALELVAGAQARGLDIFAETCTHYLIFTETMLKRRNGIKWICSPPLRSRTVRERLWAALPHGPIALVSSDDAAYSWKAKLMGRDRFDRCPNGIPGVEVRLSLLYSEGVRKGRISLARFVDLVAGAPARLFGLAPEKGSLAPGGDADIVLFNPEEKWTMGRRTLHMAADWSAYEGIKVTGRVKKVFSRGELIIDGGRFLAEKGRGRFVCRSLE